MEFKAFSVSQGEPHFLDCPVHVQFPRLPPHTNAPHTHTHLIIQLRANQHPA